MLCLYLCASRCLNNSASPAITLMHLDVPKVLRIGLRSLHQLAPCRGQRLEEEGNDLPA